MKKSGILLPHVWTSLLLSLVEASFESNGENGYIFTYPRFLKVGTNELLLRRYGNLERGVFNLKIVYQDPATSIESVALEKSYTIEEGSKDSFLQIYLQPYKTKVHTGKIIINGTFGNYKINGTHFVDFTVSTDNVVFIQTERLVYTRGDTVKFRVLRVDKDLKPSADAEADIYVNDPRGIRLFQWNRVNLGQGIKDFEFPLSDEPVGGYWNISASFKGDITSTAFKVKKSALPYFKVTIKPPSYVLADSEEVPITICAKYQYGKPVKGDLRVDIILETCPYSLELDLVNNYKGKIDGCFDYTINASRRVEKYSCFSDKLKVTCSVREFCTGVTMTEVQYIERIYSPLLLKFNHVQGQFCKPGLPYNGKLAVMYPDETPASDEDIKICYSVTRKRVLNGWWAFKQVQFCKNYTSDEEGIIRYTIPPQSTDMVTITIQAISMKYAEKTDETQRKIILTQPQTNMSLVPWYSPSGSFIQLQPVQETLLCGTKKRFKLLFTSKESEKFKFHYQVLSYGKVVHTGFIDEFFSIEDDVSSKFEDGNNFVNDEEFQLVPPINLAEDPATEEEWPSAMKARYLPSVGVATIELEIDASWSPSCHLLVYYVRDDREIVADSLRFKVARCFRNKVKLQFGDAAKQPSTETSIRVSSSPNSLCSIKIVDKSVPILFRDDQLTNQKIFRIVESFDIGKYYKKNYCNDDFPQAGLYRSSSLNRIMQNRSTENTLSSINDDSLAAFENAGFLVISDLMMFTRPCKTFSKEFGNILYKDFPGDSVFANLTVLSKVWMAPTDWWQNPPPAEDMPAAYSKVSVEAATKFGSELKNSLPETWLFNIEMTDDDGEFVTKEKLPHTITEWVGRAFCINAEDGLGISNETSIQGFQAFFLSSTLPYSVVRGEQFWITISVWSYVDELLPIKLTLDDLDGLNIVGGTIKDEICVQPGVNTNLKIKLKGTSLGQKNITIRAETAKYSGVCGISSVSDAMPNHAIQNSLIVEAEGWPIEDVESVLFCPKDEENGVFKRKFSLRVPDDVVPDTTRGFIDVTGSILGKSLDNLDNLVTLPTGCGEQNMVKFVPNIVAMNMLRETNQLTDDLENQIAGNLNRSAQQQMNFVQWNGSSNAFGMKHMVGSMFLTSFVYRYFSEADKYMGIDNKTLVTMQNWIVSNQQKNGCFPDLGKIIYRGNQDSISKEKSQGLITAYVTISLLISGYQNLRVIDSALSCIKENEDMSFYAGFLYAYAEALANKVDSSKVRIFTAKGKAITKGGVEYYHDVNATKSQDIETAAYAVLAILKSGGSERDVLPIVQYLIQNMNARGGFYSTQDTCVALEALGEFAKQTFKDSANIVLKVSGELEQDIEIKEDEKLLVKRYNIQNVPSELDVLAEGSGCAIIQKVLRYNTKTPPKGKSFNIEVVSDSYKDECKKFSISITVSYIAERKKTGMALVEVKMISGMEPLSKSLLKLYKNTDLKLMKYEIEKDVVVFYFNGITNRNKYFSFDVIEFAAVENPQPGTVSVYDYYNPEISSKTIYYHGNCEKPSSCSKKV